MSPTFIDYQTRARDFAIYKESVDRLVSDTLASGDTTKLRRMLYLLYSALGLASEAGEMAGAVKKMLRDDGGEVTHERLTSIIGETGDVLWYTSDIATLLRFSLGDAAVANLGKLRARRDAGTIGGDGDVR